jgi:hypothetical protein
MVVKSAGDRWLARGVTAAAPWLARAATLGAALVATALVSAFAAAAATGPTPPGQDSFYRYSGPLGKIAPGTVLRTRTVTVTGVSVPVTATQILYRTSGELGQATVTVTTLLRSTTSALRPTKIVSYQSAYDALGAQCDPSYTLQGGGPAGDVTRSQLIFISNYVKSGYAVLVPDYEGEGLDWTAGQESGYDTLDSIRAAERYLHLQARTTPVGITGYSGGSIATEFAAELAQSYAPSLHIVAAAAGGVPVDLLHNLTYINGSPSWASTIPPSTVATARAVGLNLRPALSSYGLQLTGQVKHACIAQFLGRYPGLTYQKLFKPQYADVLKALPSFVSVGDHMIMGRSGTPNMPMLLGVGNADGTGDGVMISRDVQQLAYEYCRRGVSVQFHEYTGDTHTIAAVAFEPQAAAFLEQRLNGLPAVNGCASITPGNSLAPTPVPQSNLLRFSWLGLRAAARGIAVQVRAPGRTQREVGIILKRQGAVVARAHLARVGTTRQTLILRANGRMPPPGDYTVTVSVNGGSLIWQDHHVG